MANEKKMTKVEMFKALKEKYEFSTAEIEFIDHEIELLEKKNSSRKPTKAQEENEAVKKQILEFMGDKVSRTVTDIQKAVGIESNQKASALIRQLKEAGLLKRTEVKGKAWFTLN